MRKGPFSFEDIPPSLRIQAAPLTGFFKGRGLCAAPLFVSFDEGSFKGVEKKRKETKRNETKRNEKKRKSVSSKSKTREGSCAQDTNKRKNLPPSRVLLRVFSFVLPPFSFLLMRFFLRVSLQFVALIFLLAPLTGF